MLLQEEYINRHSMDTPLIVYTNFGNVIFRHDELRYLVARLEWVPYSWHVGHFKIWIYYPLHNRYTDQIFKPYDDITIEWDNYQSFFRSWIPLWRNEIKPVMQHESFVACWEIFLYCFDGWLARNASPEFMRLIDKTSDFSNPNRIRCVHDAYDYLKLNHQVIAKKFRDAIFAYSTNYMDWLANLFRNNVVKTILSC